ncbi:putative ring-h2 finger protein atl21a [Quercus suber]|uniref:RING-type E3 ubiquitin transferase n=1 Tax=Quercus suber TaxID=58331 RepID=A0AAW0JRD0_QUESU
MENSLQSCIIHLFCFVLLANASEFGVEPDECEETRCGDDGPTIKFPFWLKGQQPEHCGYPGFELSCTEDDYTMLELPHSGKLYVKDIDYYMEQRIYLYYPDGCNDPRLVPNLTSSPFSFSYHMYKYTFFNCSTYKDSSRFGVMLIPCLNSTHHYQIVALDSYADASYAPQSCWKMYDSETNPSFWNYYGDQNYILLQWNSPNCKICYANGSRCIRAEENTGTSETLCLPKQKRGSPTKLIGFIVEMVYMQAHSWWYPINRPSIKVAIQMLEGEGDDLKIPPNPFESTHSMNQSLIVPGRRSHVTLSVISESE